MTQTLLHSYRNGNVDVTIYQDGTKVREWPDDEIPFVDFPESADVKITQWCDMAKVCVYCHEMSDKRGTHGDLDVLLDVWKNQPAGTEMAIGGGNPLAHPQLGKFLEALKTQGVLANVTVNQLHLKKHLAEIVHYQNSNLLRGLGISYRKGDLNRALPTEIDYSNVVFHMIMGVDDLRDCYEVIRWCKARSITPKILLLGYKVFGRGETHYSPELQLVLDKWKDCYLKILMETPGLVLSFDNLAIEQIALIDKLPKEQWEEFYQGQDGNHTMYFDAVKKEFARTSTSVERFTYTQDARVENAFEQIKTLHSD